MTDDEAKARIEVLYDDAVAILAEPGLSPLQAYCLVLEQVTVRHEPTLRLLADAAAHDRWFRQQAERDLRKRTIRARSGYLAMKHGKAMPASEPNCSLGSEKAMHDEYTRCGTPLVYAGQLELPPDIIADIGKQQPPQEAPQHDLD